MSTAPRGGGRPAVSSPGPSPRRTPLHPPDPTRRITLLAAAVVAPLVLVGLVVGLVAGIWWAGLLVGALLGGLAVYLLWQRAPGVPVAGLTTSPPDPGRDARLLNLAESLSVAIGVGVPELRIAEVPTINALVSGRSGRDATVVLTRGMLDELVRVELEGALAWCFARLRDPQLGADCFAVSVLGAVGPLRSALAGLGPQDELAPSTDRSAVAITRYPPGLAGAVARAMEQGTLVPGAPGVGAVLWFAPPIEAADGAAGTELELRLAVLREL